MAWPRLRSWLDDDVDGLRIMRHLAVAAESWDELGRPDSELYRGRPAGAGRGVARSGPAPSLTDTERDFLARSAALAEKEQRATEAQVRRERRLNQRLRLGLGRRRRPARRRDRRRSARVHRAGPRRPGRPPRPNGRRAPRTPAASAPRRCGPTTLDRSLLLAAAGVSLDDSVDTRDQPARDPRPRPRARGQRSKCRPDLPPGGQHRDRPGGGHGR